jgi:transposase
MKTPTPRIVELNTDRLEELLHRAEATLEKDDYEMIKALAESHAYLAELLEQKGITIDRLRKLLFGAGTEKTRDVVPREAEADDHTEPAEPADLEKKPAAPRKGHGRNGADAYGGAEKIHVPHPSLRSGDSCPECKQGTVYHVAKPGVLVRIVGQAPVQAKVYEIQKLRCNLCGKVFTADAPEGVGTERYDATAASMIALLKYGSGVPFNRLQGLQGNLGIPLPASTQWDLVKGTAKSIKPAYEELIRQAAQGEVLHNDDTTVKILEYMGKRAKQAALTEAASGAENGCATEEPAGTADGADAETPSGTKASTKRRGMFTTGIVSTSEGRTIALFLSGRQHAGENLTDVLAQRAADLGPPIQMADALSRNLPAEFKTIMANCLAHGRRQFVDVAASFPEPCLHVLEILGKVYKTDAIARKRDLSPEERLHFHQAKSRPLMDDLKKWLTRQFDDRLVERNSQLGNATSYLLKHWKKLTLFLEQPGAPLDNNVCERALKKAILHRKNALFYKTQKGAHVGDVFMSLIHTCQLNEADPFDYLTALQRHADVLASNPQAWMPWNYRESLEAGGPDRPAPGSGDRAKAGRRGGREVGGVERPEGDAPECPDGTGAPSPTPS